MEPKANENTKSEATPKGVDSADASTETAPGDHGIKVDEEVDVSDDALAAARNVAPEEVAEKVTEDKSAEQSDDGAESTEDASEELDDISATILASMEEPKPEAARTQTPEEKIKELERKNEKLLKALEKSPEAPAGQTAEEKQMASEDYAEWVEKTYGMDMDAFKKQMMFMNDYKRDIINPQLEGLQKELSQYKMKEQLSNNKLYGKLEADIKDIMKNDPMIASHPDEKARLQLAIMKAKEKNMPAVIAAIRKKEAAKAKANKRIVPSDRSSAAPSKAKSNFSLSDPLSQQEMKRMGLSSGDLDKYKPGKLTLDD